MNKSKRDEAWKKYFQEKMGTRIFIEIDHKFEAGYDAGFAEAQDQAKVLVDAIEEYQYNNCDCDIIGKTCTNKICMALEEYRKAVSGEL